eukprot:PDM70898.1 hypothetical protein PRIPAC_44294 [Pristionchus pacificus]
MPRRSLKICVVVPKTQRHRNLYQSTRDPTLRMTGHSPFSILALTTGGRLSLPLSSISSLENPRPSAWATRRVSPTWIIKRRTQDGF